MVSSGLFFSDQLASYHLGDGHPMNKNRIATAWKLFQEIGLKDTTVFSPSPARQEDIETIHSSDYVEEVKKLAKESLKSKNLHSNKYGLGTGDCPIFPEMFDASMLIAGATLEAAQLVLDGKIKNAFILLAGLHHAQKGNASGFCYFNDMSITIQRLRNDGYRVAYIDTDLHHGDGVQELHYNDPDVLTISFHESGQFLYPGTGFSNEIGGIEAEGTSVNLPFFPYTYDEIYQKSFTYFVPPILKKFNPDFIVWQAGVDGHANDPLGHLMLTTNTFQLIGKTIKYFADKYCEGKIIAAGGGGYNPFSIGRSWFTEFSALNNLPLPEKTPESWQIDFSSRFHEEAPTFMMDEISTEKLIDKPELVKEHNKILREVFHEELDKFYTLPTIPDF
jgi:acetoin utilization protein AcuC